MTEEKANKLGVNWNYLNIQLEAYTTLINDYHKYILATKQIGNTQHTAKILIASLSTFYLTVKASFDKYLKKNDGKITKQHYKDILHNDKLNSIHLIRLVDVITEWSQTEGCFATLTESRDPNQSFKKGTRWY